MAYIVPARNGRFEIRESRTTRDGPRSRTLSSFKELNEEAIAKARERASQPLSVEDLHRAARRVSAPVARDPIDRAARELIAELGRGRALDGNLRRILIDLLADGQAEKRPSRRQEATHEVAEWMAAGPAEKGRALVSLLLLADALPSGGRRGKPLRFPRLDSGRK